MKFPVIISKTETGYCASSPDAPGCVATGDSLDDVREGMAQLLAHHVFMEPLIGNPVPMPETIAEMIEVDPTQIPEEEAACLRKAAHDALRLWADARGETDQQA